MLIPDFKGKTIEIPLYSYTKWILALFGLAVIAVMGVSVNRYNFYSRQMHSLMNDHHVTSNSINEISMDAIQTKRELMRLKYEIGCLDRFISSAISFDKDATTKLAIPYSQMTFADYFRSNANKYDQTHPASTSPVSQETEEQKNKNLKESIARQASYKALMEVTPSGYPVGGAIVNPKRYITGPGITIKSPVGSPIRATASGKVSRIINISEECLVIEILHIEEKNKLVKSVYHFCYQPVIKIGQQIKKGQLIAFTGVHPHTGEKVSGYQVNINHRFIQPK